MVVNRQERKGTVARNPNFLGTVALPPGAAGSGRAHRLSLPPNAGSTSISSHFRAGF